MQWIECITLRSGNPIEDDLLEDLNIALKEATSEESSCFEAILYRSAQAEGDIAINLRHKGAKKPKPSQFSERLTAELSAFGLLHYRIWIATTGDEEAGEEGLK